MEENQEPEDYENAHIREREKAMAKKAEEALVDMYKTSIISPIRTIVSDICWSVACAETVEARYNHGKPAGQQLSLSPQYLLDYIVIGKGKGKAEDTVAHFKKATNLVIQNGLPKDSDYPFAGVRSKKRRESHLWHRTKISNAVELTEGITEDSVKTILNAGNGPLLVVFNTDLHFGELKSGEIYRGPVDNDKVDLHAVVVIGYGKSGEENFWNVRNCYGTKWCDNGYGRVSTSINIVRLWYPTGFT